MAVLCQIPVGRPRCGVRGRFGPVSGSDLSQNRGSGYRRAGGRAGRAPNDGELARNVRLDSPSFASGGPVSQPTIDPTRPSTRSPGHQGYATTSTSAQPRSAACRARRATRHHSASPRRSTGSRRRQPALNRRSPTGACAQPAVAYRSLRSTGGRLPEPALNRPPLPLPLPLPRPRPRLPSPAPAPDPRCRARRRHRPALATPRSPPTPRPARPRRARSRPPAR
jgi:hypothetical protein